MKMDIEDGLNLITTAFKNDNKEKLYQMYIAQYPYMDEKNYITFDQFYNKTTHTAQAKKEDKEKVHKKVDDILRMVCN